MHELLALSVAIRHRSGPSSIFVQPVWNLWWTK